jgi:hypothetical protein
MEWRLTGLHDRFNTSCFMELFLYIVHFLLSYRKEHSVQLPLLFFL